MNILTRLHFMDPPETGDLRKDLQLRATDWNEMIEVIWMIAGDMKSIHIVG